MICISSYYLQYSSDTTNPIVISATKGVSKTSRIILYTTEKVSRPNMEGGWNSVPYCCSNNWRNDEGKGSDGSPITFSLMMEKHILFNADGRMGWCGVEWRGHHHPHVDSPRAPQKSPTKVMHPIKQIYTCFCYPYNLLPQLVINIIRFR